MKKEIRIISFDEFIEVQRNLGTITNQKNGTTVIAFGGIHGNERAGVNALITVFKTIKEKKIPVFGNFYGIAGNLNALQKNIRFETVDLNRIWTNKNIQFLESNQAITNEDKELKEIYLRIKHITQKHSGPFYFLDLHTTSAETQPFITISDSLNNRRFSSNFNIPTILGIEEFLDGPLLTYINEFGHVALGFEAGQHEAKNSVTNCESFLWMSLLAASIVYKSDLKQVHNCAIFLEKQPISQAFFEIDFKYTIKPTAHFAMLPDYQNFQKIKRNDVLAFSDQRPLRAPFSGRIFMPLYQDKGEDGFFIIRNISSFWLQVSKVFRKLKLDILLRILPGVKVSKTDNYTLIVNKKTAKFLAVEIFHLFGYRKKTLIGNKLYFTRRDRAISKFP